MNSATEPYYVLEAWATDMIRALNGRNMVWRWLFKLSLGRRGRTEYRGFCKAADKYGFSLDYDYYPHGVEYESV